jgi:hypothetical protein
LEGVGPQGPDAAGSPVLGLLREIYIEREETGTAGDGEANP